jgi:hypothetical protein
MGILGSGLIRHFDSNQRAMTSELSATSSLIGLWKSPSSARKLI